MARISKKLVTLDQHVALDVPVEELAVHEPDYKHLIAFLKAMEFNTLTRRVAEKSGIEAGEIEADAKLTSGSASRSSAAPSAGNGDLFGGPPPQPSPAGGGGSRVAGASEKEHTPAAHGSVHNIFSAVAMGEVEVIKTLVAQSPADLDRPMDSTNHRRRPLHLAVVKKQPAALAALLDVGADPEALDASGLTPLDQAALDGEHEMAELLIARGARVGVPAALGLQRTEDLERLLRADPDCLEPGNRWAHLIVRAGAHGSAALVDTLVSHGASVNVRDEIPIRPSTRREAIRRCTRRVFTETPPRRLLF